VLTKLMLILFIFNIYFTGIDKAYINPTSK